MNTMPPIRLTTTAVVAAALLQLCALLGRQALAAPATIVALQAERRSASVALEGPRGRHGSATLTQLNPGVNAWLLLTLQWSDPPASQDYHLENADPSSQRVALATAQPGQLLIDTPDGASTSCTLWPGDTLERARRSLLPYAPLCDGKLYLRNAVRGNRSRLEATTEFLRDHVWRGEDIVGFVRRQFYGDAFAERARPASASGSDAPRSAPASAPPAAPLKPDHATAAVRAEGLGIDLGTRSVRLGEWYAAAGVDKVFVSVVQPGALGDRPSAGAARRHALDPVEADALAYLVAFDLAGFELGFELGTEHPRLGWSERVPADRRDPALAGPDGFDCAAPLARTGMLSPSLQARAVATFTGGFKREHGAFRHGALAAVNHGSHYGFIEQGVVLSTLVPGLSTLYVLSDGAVGMKTWGRDDERLLGRIRHARQNGVPLVEPDAKGGPPVAGSLVNQWGPGNWSGSADEKLRALRAGACLIETPERRFLVYGYFSTATPAAMARVFQSYGCSYAMHLDMNALEHTYLALYARSGSSIAVEHLVQGMAVLDKSSGGALVPRFLGFADDRDFFYLVRRQAGR